METEDFSVRVRGDEASTNEPKKLTMEAVEAEALQKYSVNGKIYSVYIKGEDENGGSNSLTYERLRELAKSPQSNLDNMLQIISICHQYVNMDDIIGLTNECIENNVNTDLRCAYHGESKKATDPVKQFIDDFNKMIDVKAVIARAIPAAWRDGTCIFCLRKKIIKGVVRYTVDFYPLGVAKISDYEIEGQPYVLIDVNELKRRLNKMYPKTKNNRGLFFDNMEQEVKASYPEEVYKAYKQKERYAKIPIERSGVLRVNNQSKPYGLSPIFRALWPTLMLEAFGNADKATANARAKKIIAQFLNKEILGENFNRDSFAQQAYAHQNLMAAWKMPTVVATAPATVSDIKYVEPKADMTNINQINYYRQKAMGTLGISFLADSNSSSISVANISLKQLMKTINKIARQMERILEKWYEGVLVENGFKPEQIPIVKIEGAEMMDLEMRKELADTLFTKFNCSYETVYGLYGVDFENEKNLRDAENSEGMEEVFAPRMTAYTASNKNTDEGGRPANTNTNDPDKQIYDKGRNSKETV